MRVYHGTEDQAPDPLIEAIEGSGDPPAFRGTAYVVFEDLPLDAFGSRIPQLSFEVFRAPAPNAEAPRLEELVRGVTMIPGSGEFTYATSRVVADLGYGRERSENALNSRGVPNIEAALDDLTARLPNCESVMLVVAWFGDDLRCGSCQIRPGVETTDKIARPYDWLVGGVDRAGAYLVSTTDGRPSYGGTPADASVLEAIAAIKARGLAVGLYPFVLMDVAPGNALADPYGGAEQAAFPWRGRITCHPAAGEPGSPDKTTAAGDQVRAFFGDCAPSDFTPGGNTVSYAGPSEWSFRRFILHHAWLAQMAGGVDSFIVGSEMRGLTQVRESASAYPAVGELRQLLLDVRGVVGPDVQLSYAADWSEYFGHQPSDGSGDVHFHLDALWSEPEVDFVGVDWYAPLSDWRDGAGHLDAASAGSIYDLDYLRGNVEGGEGFDWWYASQADRDLQVRAPIADGAAGKPWVFRYKDLRSWWSQPHYDRPGGVESGSPTAWVPQSKPIWFVEAGCPAVDKGSNQPNLFVDAKSSESAVPHYSAGRRDDLIQRRVVEALLTYWDPASGINPTSSVYGGPMLAMERAHIWTWDARPFPDFPARAELWSDGPSWRLGHWLTGRLGLAPLASVVEEIVGRVGAEADAAALDGLVTGFVIDRPMSARAALEGLASAYGFMIAPRADRLAAVRRNDAPIGALDGEALAPGEKARRLVRLSEELSSRPRSARLGYVDEVHDYRAASVLAAAGAAEPSPAIRRSAPVVLDAALAAQAAQAWIVDAAMSAEGLLVRLPPSQIAYEAGDAVTFDGRVYRIDRVDDGLWRELELRRTTGERGAFGAAGAEAGVGTAPVAPPPAPLGVMLDVPLIGGEGERNGPRIAVAASPWPGHVAALAGADASALVERARIVRPSVIGELLWDLYAGPVGRWDEGNVVQLFMPGGELQSVTPAAVLGGANLLAVEGAGGEWELLQFREAALVAPDTFEIRGLLRGLAGSEHAQGQPVTAGARVVLMSDAAAAASVAAHERGAPLSWRFAPAGVAPSSEGASALAASYAARDVRPLAPVHLRVRRSDGDLTFSWRRRTRLGGDDWASPEVPLGESEERYRFELLDGAEVALAREVTGPTTSVSGAEEAAVFADAPRYAFDVRIAQYSSVFGFGVPREAAVYV